MECRAVRVREAPGRAGGWGGGWGAADQGAEGQLREACACCWGEGPRLSPTGERRECRGRWWVRRSQTGAKVINEVGGPLAPGESLGFDSTLFVNQLQGPGRGRPSPAVLVK